MALALYAAYNAVLNKEKIRLRKNIFIYKKRKDYLCRVTKMRHKYKVYNKKCFKTVKL